MNVDSLSEFYAGFRLFGNGSNILFPINDENLVSTSSADIVACVSNINRSEYTLIANNETIGVKMYARIVNGIIADDYFVEFYDSNGMLLNVIKSSYTMDYADILTATNRINRLNSINNSNSMDQNDDSIRYLLLNVDEEFRLVEKHVATNGTCDCYEEVIYYDVFSGEAIRR